MNKICYLILITKPIKCKGRFKTILNFSDSCLILENLFEDCLFSLQISAKYSVCEKLKQRGDKTNGAPAQLWYKCINRRFANGIQINMSTDHCSPETSASPENCWCITDRLDEVNYIWKINNFSVCEDEGYNMKSPPFSAKGNEECQWVLELVFDDYCLNLFLDLNDHNQKYGRVLTKSVFSILNKAGSEIFTVSPKCFEYERSYIHVDNGWFRFIHVDEIFSNEVLLNDTLRISFHSMFLILDDRSTERIFRRFNAAHRCDSENFASVLESHDFADFTLSVQGKDYPVHKVVLATKCDYFAKMFKSGMKENNENRVEITDITTDVMDELLKFIYTGKCENLNKLADGLLAAADKYNMNNLKIICIDYLSNSLSIDNAAHILVIADLYQLNQLKSNVIDFIVTKIREVVNSTTWDTFMPMYPQLMNDVIKALSRR